MLGQSQMPRAAMSIGMGRWLEEVHFSEWCWKWNEIQNSLLKWAPQHLRARGYTMRKATRWCDVADHFYYEMPLLWMWMSFRNTRTINLSLWVINILHQPTHSQCWKIHQEVTGQKCCAANQYLTPDSRTNIGSAYFWSGGSST